MGEDLRNYTKARALYCLSKLEEHGEEIAWQALPYLVTLTGCKLRSLSVLIPRWEKWRLVKVHHFTASQMYDGHAHTFVRLDSRGRDYIAKMPTWYARFSEAKQEVDSRMNEDCDIRRIRPRAIVWRIVARVPDGVKCIGFVGLTWPFSSSDDAFLPFTAGKSNFLVDDISTAYGLAQDVFRIVPSKSCIDTARAMHQGILNDFLRKANVR